MHLEDQRPSSCKLVRVEGPRFEEWICSECDWVFNASGAPTGKSLDEMKRNYQTRLSEEFAFHACAERPRIKEAKDSL
jgi:transposase-like protein